ncbi:MAG: signal peptidase I [Oscillospiraceae bacterium]|nr:signal peptidase I [Oscillospiraceae bacterium]
MSQSTPKSSDPKQKVLTIIGTILCIILLPILIINLTLIAKSYINEDEIPSLGGVFPMIVLTDSMYPQISAGDLIICNTLDPEDVRVDDVISFFDPMGSGTSVVTHRVLEIVEENGTLSYRTKGDNNNAEDQVLVPQDKLVGIYRNRIPGLGHVAMFMQTTPGLILCVVCPVLLMVGFDMLRRKKYEKAKQQDTDALLAELEALRALKAEKEKQEQA